MSDAGDTALDICYHLRDLAFCFNVRHEDMTDRGADQPEYRRGWKGGNRKENC